MAEQELVDFFNQIWGTEDTVVRLASLGISGEDWKHQHFSWPLQTRPVLDWINRANTLKREVFFAPDLFKLETLTSNSGTKDMVAGSRTIFLDFDGGAPDNDEWYIEHGLPRPTIRVRTSEEDRQHVYWILDEPITTISTLENIRRTLANSTTADLSGWDAGQLLRVPDSINFKYSKNRTGTYDVFIEEFNSTVHNISSFPIGEKEYEQIYTKYLEHKDHLPTVEQVLAKGNFTDLFLEVIDKSAIKPHRSDALLHLAYCAAESGLSYAEIYVIVRHIDNTRIHKYTNRPSADKYLADIVDRAKRKHPHGLNRSTELDVQVLFNVKEALEYVNRMVFIYEDLITERGYTVLNGRPGVGKTTLALRLAFAAASGKDFITWKNLYGEPCKVLFFSLEIPIEGIQYFLEQMTDQYTDYDEFEKIANNFIIAPLATRLRLDKDSSKGRTPEQLGFMNYIKRVQPKIVIIDSLWMASGSSVSVDETIRNLSEFFNDIRKELDCAIVLISHSKKGSSSYKLTGDMDDAIGARSLSADINVMITVDKNPDDDSELFMYTSKKRFGKPKPPFVVTVTDTLDFKYARQLDDTRKKESNLSAPFQVDLSRSEQDKDFDF